MALIEKIQYQHEEHALCIFGKTIPISVIKLNVEVILMIVLVYWAFIQGIVIQQDNIKITAYLAGRNDCTLETDASGHMAWDCSLNTSSPRTIAWPK
jgi:hypothetical protein